MIFNNYIPRCLATILFTIYSVFLISQTNKQQEFLTYFNSQSLAGKVKAFDTLDLDFKQEYYPLVKDELLKIKAQAITDNKETILDRLQKIEAELYFTNKNYAKAIPILTDLLAKHKINDYKDSVRVLYCLKNSLIKIHSLNKAVEIHKNLEAIRKSHKDINEWMFHPKLSIIYYEMKMYKECLKQQLLEYDELKHSSYMILGYFNNRGLFWQKEGNLDSSLSCFTKAKEIFHQTYTKEPFTNQEKALLGLLDGNIGQVYLAQKDFKKAIPLLQKDITCSKLINDKLNAAVSEIELSKCYLNLNNLKLCKQALDSANAVIILTDDYSSKLKLLKQYATYYHKAGDLVQAIIYYNKYIDFKDSIEKQENTTQLIAVQVANQMAEKEKLIAQSQRNIREKNLEVSKQKVIRNTLILGGLFLIGVIIFVSVQLRKTRYQKQLFEIKNKQIETRNEIINKSLSEKDLLIKEVHHRVKNNLQIISSLMKLQSAKSSNEEVKNSLKEAHDRINSMALLHQLLYRNNQMTNILFNEYLNDLISQISNGFALNHKNISIKTHLIHLELDLDTAIPLGLITNELVSNAYKHAFNGNPGGISIELNKLVKNTYVLKISDNGKGLPKNFDLHSNESLGLDIVFILSEQINAELKIYNNNGAIFEIIFKVV